MQSTPTPDQLRAGRALLGLEQQPLAREAGVSVATLRRAETGSAPNDTMRRVAEALIQGGVQFVESGVQLRTPADVAASGRRRRIDELLAQADAIPVVDPTATEASLYGDDGLPC